MRAPTGAEVIALCSRIDEGGLRAGASRAELEQQALLALDQEVPLPPLNRAEAVFTPWSDRLAAIVWSGDGFEGMERVGWAAALAPSLEKHGWSLVADTGFASAFAQRWERAAPGPQGRRTMRVEVEEFGGFMLRCGPAALMDLMADEALGDLPADAPRPAAPGPQDIAAAAAALRRLDCTDPVLVGRLAGAEDLMAIGPVVEAFAGVATELDPQAAYQRRLRTWLEARLRQSGRVGEERIAAAIAAIGPPPPGGMEDVLQGFAAVAAAHERRDGAAICAGLATMLDAAHAEARRDAADNAAINAALEALARKAGVAIG